jgi:hypothetical protein
LWGAQDGLARQAVVWRDDATAEAAPAGRDSTAFTSGADTIVQIRVWLLGASPMMWRRVLVPVDSLDRQKPVSLTLRELHGVIQVAMGWEGSHLYQFRLRAARYGSWELSTFSPDVTLASLQFRKGARFIYEYLRCNMRLSSRRRARGNTFVTEEALQIGDVHTERQQAGRHRVAQQMRVDTFADRGSNGDGPDDLTDPLARQHVWRWPRAFLTTGEQRPNAGSAPPGAFPLPWRMVITRSTRLTSSTRSCTNSEALARFPATSVASVRYGRSEHKPGRESEVLPRPSVDRQRCGVPELLAARRAP